MASKGTLNEFDIGKLLGTLQERMDQTLSVTKRLHERIDNLEDMLMPRRITALGVRGGAYASLAGALVYGLAKASGYVP